jgi:plastocyanin
MDGIAVQLFKFRPDRADIKAGTRVTWTNQDEITHTVTAGTPDKPDPAFDFRLAGKGTTAGFEFGKPGVYTYFCARHPAMRGEIHVN